MKIVKFSYRKPAKLYPLDPKKVDAIALHHTGKGGNIYSHTNYHIDDNKWDWLGYGYYIDLAGVAWEVRGFNHMNAGVEYNNGHIVSIAIQCDCNSRKPTDAQLKSLRLLIKYLKSYLPNVKIVDGHKKWNNTSCPGKYFPLADFKEGGITLLRMGDLGDSVKELQNKLNTLGYNLIVDGDFGGLTRNAVMDFQKSRHLVVDGIVGPVTWKWLEE